METCTLLLVRINESKGIAKTVKLWGSSVQLGGCNNLAFNRKMLDSQMLLPVICQAFVEGSIFFFGNLVWLPHPNRFLLIHHSPLMWHFLDLQRKRSLQSVRNASHENWDISILTIKRVKTKVQKKTSRWDWRTKKNKSTRVHLKLRTIKLAIWTLVTIKSNMSDSNYLSQPTCRLHQFPGVNVGQCNH